MQAQDRCHRIGQTREVHIYRLVSEKTIEENILIKSDQKRHLDHLAIGCAGEEGSLPGCPVDSSCSSTIQGIRSRLSERLVPRADKIAPS